MKQNKFREKLNNNEPTISTHILSTWPSIVEAIGHTGIYDYVEFVAEYGSFDLHELDNLCRAIELHGMGSMIKIDQSHQAFLAQRGIGAGFESVLFTDVRSVADVKECILLATPDTPPNNGLYGVATRVNSYMGYGGSPDYVENLNQTVIAFMIEKKGAVDDLEEILSLDRVDMIQWGGSDYAMNIGKPGERYSPDIVKTQDYVFKTAMKMGVPPRAEIHTVEDAKRFVDMGVRHFSLGTDLAILYNWLKENGSELRKVIESI